jgi:AcrR family transcriptional regulator
VARPKKVSDEQLVASAYELLMEHGPKSLTFEKLGEKVGLVPAALVRRFKNKQGLLMEVDRYAVARSSAYRKEAMDAHDSPIDAILAGFITELSFATTLENFIHGVEFLLMDLADKDLYDNYHVSFRMRHKEVADLIRKAQAKGELSADINPEEISRLLQLIVHGSGHVWAMSQEGPIEDYINHFVRLALKPYRPPYNANNKEKK